MTERVLVTGGGGFIGSHLTGELIRRGYAVRVLDDLTPQVHASHGRLRPPYLSSDAEFVVGDVRDGRAVRKALNDVDAVVHLAAAVGVGQSMYEVEHYTQVNNVGTAVLMEALADRPVRRLVVASSMSIYGEGRYRRGTDGGLVDDATRTRDQLAEGSWDPVDPRTGDPLTPVPTPESKRPELASVYALSKFDQEKLCLILGRAYDIPTVALRFFNVYGPHQALSNPYTGVLAIFASRILNGKPPLVFEDGLQQRDFVSVHDVATACRLALERENVQDETFNVGSGRPRSVLDVAHGLLDALDRPDLAPEVASKYRVGDVRHCFADISHARSKLGYAPRVRFGDGLRELAGWLETQHTAEDRFDGMRSELEKRRLVM